ncbi:MAG: sugar porter family MFS transporter [Schleiferiaceae bacterium]|nr:sugar porter family MFS transporter [Schleiferiaceae bacterium]
MQKTKYIIMVTALIVALGGLLMGFDASVISGVVKFIEIEFELTKLELGWSVASLTLTSTLAMLMAGPLSDKYGRRAVLRAAAILYAISALGSALAPDFFTLVIARMIGGFGVGASLILAPMYIAEIAPANLRGQLVSFNQLNIVVGISLAFFTNYLILHYSQQELEWVQNFQLDQHQWRYMLGLELIPAVLYYIGLFFVPRSPRWLIMKGKRQEALKIMSKFSSLEEAEKSMAEIISSMELQPDQKEGSFKDLLKPALRLVITIGIVVAVLQQITGINSVFFYAPMIFEQSGIGTDAAFIQAILVGLVNLVFTILAILFIDKLGRKPLLTFGVAGIALSMFTLAYGFSQTTYTLKQEVVENLVLENDVYETLTPIVGTSYDSKAAFESAIQATISGDDWEIAAETLLNQSIVLNPLLILIAILAFVASFAISIGPVMWVLFSELFPNNIRGIAISFVGLINSAVSFLVQWIFPWQLEVLGSAGTFLIYGLFALLGLIFILKVVPETKGRTLEELEAMLVKEPH